MLNNLFKTMIACSVVFVGYSAPAYSSTNTYQVSSILPSRVVGDIVVMTLPGEKENHYVMIYAIFNLNNTIHFIALTLDDPETKLYFLRLNPDRSIGVVGVLKDPEKIKKVLSDFT